MKPWLFVGAKVTPAEGDQWFNWARPGVLDGLPSPGTILTVACITTYAGMLAASFCECNCLIFAEDLRPVLPDTTREVEAMKRLVRDARPLVSA